MWLIYMIARYSGSSATIIGIYTIIIFTIFSFQKMVMQSKMKSLENEINKLISDKKTLKKLFAQVVEIGTEGQTKIESFKNLKN